MVQQALSSIPTTIKKKEKKRKEKENLAVQ
jgi:hypothetical protein